MICSLKRKYTGGNTSFYLAKDNGDGRTSSASCHVNIMDPYRPCGNADAAIDRPLNANEFNLALQLAGKTTLTQLNDSSLSDPLKTLGLY